MEFGSSSHEDIFTTQPIPFLFSFRFGQADQLANQAA